ncbi:DUF3644 domain-containing protein [Bradyrhizobium cenepequi]
MAPRESLGIWEVALIKAFIHFAAMKDQEILPYFSRPGRSINHRVIGEIRTGSHFKNVEMATEEELRVFRERWHSYSVKSGKQREIEELVLKARESQIAAIQVFNNPNINFRAETFIVLSVIGWTYLFHAYFKKRSIDYRYYSEANGIRSVQITKDGLERYWELSTCLDAKQCPFDDAVKENLRYLIEVRNSIAHRFTGNIDLKVASKLQASALNFNSWLAGEFGGEYRIDSDFGVAIQMSSFSHDHAKLIYSAQSVDPKIASIIDGLDDKVSEDIQADTKYAFKVLFVEQSCNRAGQADKVVEFIRAGTDMADQIEHVVFKEREKPKFKPSQIVSEMKKCGFKWFNMATHTNLRRELDAKNTKNGYGVELADGQWYYYDNWLSKVKDYCEKTQAELLSTNGITIAK